LGLEGRPSKVWEDGRARLIPYSLLIQRRLSPFFQRVEKLGEFDLHSSPGRVVNRVALFRCLGYRGGRLLAALSGRDKEGRMVMAENVEQLTVNYEEDGIEIVQELDKEILSKGAWATVLFRYRQWQPSKEAYTDDKYTIRRYRKMKGVYRTQSKFNISSRDQAAKIVAALSRWIED
jgi:hypothetical protein